MAFMDNPAIYMTSQMWKFSEGNRGKVLLYFTMFILANLISLLEPLVVAILLNTIQLQGITSANINTILFILGLFIAVEVGHWAFHGPARIIENNNAFLVRANYKKYMLRGTMALPISWHAEHHSGDTIDKIEKGAYSIREFSSHTFALIHIIVNIIASYIILVFFNIHSAYIAAALIVLMFSISLRFDKILIPQWSKLFKAENVVSARVFDIISNIHTIVILRMEKISLGRIIRKIMAPYDLEKKNSKINEAKWFLVSMTGIIMLVLLMGTYILNSFTIGVPILIGTLYALYGYVQRIRNYFFEFTWRYSDIVCWRTALRNSEEISKEFVSEKLAVKPIDLTKPWKKIQINGLSFNYHDVEGELHLNNISLEIKRGEKIALVGESGSGKTTFLKLIRALYKPKQASISVDGMNIPGFEALAPNITLVPQDPELFDATVMENITMGLPYRLEHIKKCTDMACFTQVAIHLPKKFNSHIKEKGVNLSTGEKQRLALSRGLLAAEKSSILLLDEPTSSVDPTNEVTIYDSIFRKFKGKTIISSVHRLHLLSNFDTIYVFKKGRIIARGSLKDLMKSAEFSRMWKRYTEKEPMHERF